MLPLLSVTLWLRRREDFSKVKTRPKKREVKESTYQFMIVNHYTILG
jgi:hypothetical protein